MYFIIMNLEKELSLALKTGNQKEISLIFKKIYDTYYRLILYVLSLDIKNKEDVLDLTQESFVTLFNEILKNKEIRNIKYYLLTITKNKINLYKKEYSKKIEVENIEELSRSEDYKIEPLIKEELSKLNKNELEIVIKHIYQNLTFKEILALSKGKYNSINTIKSIYLRAIKKLKEGVNK